MKAQNDDALHPEHKANRSICCPELKEEALQWVRSCAEWIIPIVTGAAVQEKASAIRERMLVAVSPAAAKILAPLSLSNGWLCRFQKRHHLTSKRIHGEMASVKTTRVEDWRPILRAVTNGYARRDIYNMDETAYSYCAAPSKMIAMKRFASRKSLKKRMTVAVACNADGSFKLPLLFVGGSRRPRCFGGKSPTELGVEYVSSGKGWMDSELFQGWAERFNDKMRSENRHVLLLLLDNVSSHHLEKPLSNVTLHIFPPNTTSYLQAQDAGIIRQFKEEISQLQNRYVIDRFDALLARVSEASKDDMEQGIEVLRHVGMLEAI